MSVHHPDDDKIKKFSWKLEGTGGIIDTTGNAVGEMSTLQNEVFIQLPEEIDTSDTVTVYTILSFVDDSPRVIKEGPIFFSEILSEIRQAPLCSPYLSMQEKSGKATGQDAAVNAILEENPAKGVLERIAKKDKTEKNAILIQDKFKSKSEKKKIIILQPTKYKLAVKPDSPVIDPVDSEDTTEQNIHESIAKRPVDAIPQEEVLQVKPVESKSAEIADIVAPKAVILQDETEKINIPASDKINLEPSQKKIVVLNPTKHKLVEETHLAAGEDVEKEEELVEQSTVAGLVEQAVETIPEEVLMDESTEVAVQPATVRVVMEFDAEKRTEESEKLISDAQEAPVVLSVPADEEATEDEVESVAEPVEEEVKVVQSSTIEPDNLPLGTDKEKGIKDDALPVTDIQTDQDIKTPPTRLSKDKPADATKENLGKSLW